MDTVRCFGLCWVARPGICPTLQALLLYGRNIPAAEVEGLVDRWWSFIRTQVGMTNDNPPKFKLNSKQVFLGWVNAFLTQDPNP